MSEDLRILPQNVQQARDLGASHYYTGKACKHGHFSKRRVSDNKCLECNANSARKRRADPKKKLIIDAQRKASRAKNKAKINEERRIKYEKDPVYRIKIQSGILRRKFGFGIERYDEIYEIQNGACAICKKADTGSTRTERFAIDHDHNSGRVRGLLCKTCNTLLGNARDEPQILKRAIAYLKYHRVIRAVKSD